MANILWVSDSPYLDTGLGRVTRVVTKGLHDAGHNMCVLAWTHRQTDRLIPFRVIPISGRPGDEYGRITYGQVLEHFRPDAVVAHGDWWAMTHIANGPRPNRMHVAGYFTIDSQPVAPEGIAVMRAMDTAVMCSRFGAAALNDPMGDPQLPSYAIPLGVDTSIFHPLSREDRNEARFDTGVQGKFVVGCVARNNTRKMLPTLLKAFKLFISPWHRCGGCGHVHHNINIPERCAVCGGATMISGGHKNDAVLYLHTEPRDQFGPRLLPLIERLGLRGRVAFPAGGQIGCGVADSEMARLYACFDLFVLPTAAEGWCLPLQEAMACGVPALATDYGGHTDFFPAGIGRLKVAEFITNRLTGGDHAIVDTMAMVKRMDAFYFDAEGFQAKWGTDLERWGQWAGFGLPARYRHADECRAAAVKCTWKTCVQSWVDLVASWNLRPAQAGRPTDPVLV